MWFTFAACALVYVLVLYVPGWLICRALRLRGAFALAAAPLASLAVLAALCIVYGKLGVKCSWASVFLPVLGLGIIALALSLWLERRGVGPASLLSCDTEKRARRFDYASLALYVVVGMAVCAYVFVKSLDGPEAFFARHDNITHINLVRSYLDSGIWSTLQASNYLTSPEYAISRIGGGFYPAAWHDTVTLLCSLTNCSIPLGINVANAVIAGGVYPAAMWTLMRVLFPGNRQIVLLGAVATMAFTAFPWVFFTKGPLYSNLLAFALLPAALALFIGGTRNWGRLKSIALLFAAIGLLSFISLALSQPNALFSALVFLIPYGGMKTWTLTATRPTHYRAIALVLYLVSAIGLWLILFCLPFLQDVIWYEWRSNKTLPDALFRTMTLSFTSGLPQIALILAVLAGSIYLIVAKKSWLLVPPAFFACCYLLCATTDGFAKHLLAGFWYTDQARITACTTIFLTPVAAAGLWTFVQLIAKGMRNVVKDSDQRRAYAATAIVLTAAFCLYNFFPSYHVPGDEPDQTTASAFGYVKQRMAKYYNTHGEKVYDSEEQAFVERVVATIPKDALVINQPHDGSVFAYGLNNLNTYFRQVSRDNETSNALLIRKQLRNIAKNEKVQQAVKETGARYVLLLDQGVKYDEGVWLKQYGAPELWKGINKITDKTPGFKVVLSEGDMRLYEIE